MPLLTLNKVPPGGFRYREGATGWELPEPTQPFEICVEALRKHRAANPRFKLDPSSQACAMDLEEYTCKRLSNDPKWCVQDRATAKMITEARIQQEAACCGRKRIKD